MTLEEFKKEWLQRHVQYAIPFFLYFKLDFYAQVPIPPLLRTESNNPQIYGPFTSSDPSLDLTPYSVVGEASASPELITVMTTGTGCPKWVLDYYKEVILVDEKRCLGSAALEHGVGVAADMVRGRREVVIRDGKALVDVGEEARGVWREYEGRGNG